ncbi:MAG: MBL fold metallo-hydrolase [Microbacterium sp.]
MESKPWSRLTTRVLAPNPGPMTLDGTNTYVLRAPGADAAVVVDPGPEISEHLDRIDALGPIELILLTHHHPDHVEAAPTLAARTGAPVRAMEPTLCIDAPPLRDDEEIDAGGTRIVVLATPGHTSDSVCFHLPDDGALDSAEPVGSVLTGDTILGRGTTILAQAEGALHDYLASLERLRDLPQAQLVLPAHGPKLPSLRTIAGRYHGHRHLRLIEIQRALASLGAEPSRDAQVVSQVTDIVYAGLNPAVRFAAEASTAAHLEYLVGR